VYRDAATYQVSLHVIGPGGADIHSIQLDVLEGPTLDFAVKPRRGRAPLSVKIENRSSGEITGFRWGFGDGGESQDRDPLPHRYARPGEYAVELHGIHSETGEELEPMYLTIRVGEPLDWNRIGIIASVVVAALLLLWLIYRRFLGPPRVRVGDVFELDSLGPNPGDSVSIGGGRKKPDRSSHDIALPPKGAMFADYATFLKSTDPPNIAVTPTSSDSSVFLAKCSEDSRFSLPDEYRAVTLSDMQSALMRAKDHILINDQPYVLSKPPGESETFISGWRLLPSSGTAGITIRRNAISLEVGPLGTPLIAGDRIDMAGSVFVFRTDDTGRSSLLLDSVPSVQTDSSETDHSEDS